MKARVKATGNIVDVEWYGDYSTGTIYSDARGTAKYYKDELDFDTLYDYWTRLEHQAAIAVMQGMVSNSEMFIELGNKKGLSVENAIAEASIKVAHALVEKMKEEK